MNKNLRKIIADKTSGSTELVAKINSYFLRCSNDLPLIKNSIKELKAHLSSFEIVISYFKNLTIIIAGGDIKVLHEFLIGYDCSLANTYSKIYLNLKPFLKRGSNILTLSNSQTVYEVLKLLFLDDKKIKVNVAESRPSLEGRIMSKKLLNIGVPVKLIPDCLISEYISQSDLVLIGADKILKNFDVVNKVGSKNAAIIAKHFKIRLLVAASQNKFSRQKKFKLVFENPGDIWKYKHPNLTIENTYFEVIPRKLISKIITESGYY
jgi:hypothetical protein